MKTIQKISLLLVFFMTIQLALVIGLLVTYLWLFKVRL